MSRASENRSTGFSNKKDPQKKDGIITSIDIGSTKVAIVVGVLNQGRIDIVGVGRAACSGIRQGVVVDIVSTIESIKKAREEAELMAGYKISEVWVGVGGPHIKSFDSKGMVAIRNKEVTPPDIERVIEAAKAVAVPADRQVLHVLPREYKIDEQEGICDPIGMSGVRLEASVHIVTGGQTAIHNLVKCIERAGLEIAGLVLSSLASSLAILSEDEKNLGAVLVDMGGSTCDLIFYLQGSVAQTSLIPVGGHHFTQDVAVGLRTPQASAEELKRKYGCALTTLVNESETIEVPGVGGRKSRTVLRRNLCEVIEPRAEETLNLINNEIHRSGLINRLGSGVILTGGASVLDGLSEMGEFLFDIPVRRGAPTEVGGLTDVVKSATFATAVGLLIYAARTNRYFDRGLESEVNPSFEDNLNQAVSSWFQKVKTIFGESEP
jgi:cell division protein FtsA